MRLLFISHEYPPVGGGGSNACLHLAREYANKGHMVDIVTVWWETERETETREDGMITIYRVRSKRARKESCDFGEMLDFILQARPVAEKLIRELKKNDSGYDVCLIFFGIPSGVLGYYLKKKNGLPYVIRFGGGDIPGFQERFKKVYQLTAPAIRTIWKNAAALVANSRGLEELAYEFCDKYPIHVIYNGVDTDMFSPVDGALAENRDLSAEEDIAEKAQITLLFVSRLIERKGLQYIIPELNYISKKTNKNIRLLIVGDGPYRSTLEELSREAMVEHIVEFVGQKNKEELPDYYRKGDLFVFPSQKEGMPNAVLEAMASGLPIVMSSCQGSEELIDGNGIIAKGDKKQFCDGIVSMLNKPKSERVAMGKISRRRAETLFSWNNTANAYLELFKEVAEKVTEIDERFGRR